MNLSRFQKLSRKINLAENMHFRSSQPKKTEQR